MSEPAQDFATAHGACRAVPGILATRYLDSLSFRLSASARTYARPLTSGYQDGPGIGMDHLTLGEGCTASRGDLVSGLSLYALAVAARTLRRGKHLIFDSYIEERRTESTAGTPSRF